MDYEGVVLPNHKIKEIRTYVAHEIYRVQKRVDTAYKSYDQYKALLKSIDG